MAYKKYDWIGNRLDSEEMSKLYHLSKKHKKPITLLVKEAIELYLSEN
jgi:predicted DNA-binding protein